MQTIQQSETKLFHRHIASGYGKDGVPYGHLVLGGVDGMGVMHAKVEMTCDSCGEHFIAAMVHLSKEEWTALKMD